MLDMGWLRTKQRIFSDSYRLVQLPHGWLSFAHVLISGTSSIDNLMVKLQLDVQEAA